MILEAIVGLNRDDYLVDAETKSGSASLGQALSLEDASARFYRDAAAKMPIREVARLFDRLAREHERQSKQLEAGTAEGTQRPTGASA
jgi:rubrerythrin